jgi:vacuolar-type H+-ATPase subunit D/Vma8
VSSRYDINIQQLLSRCLPDCAANAPPTLLHNNRNTPVSGSDRLDGLVKNWQNRLHVKLAAIREKQEEIALFGAEIEKTRQRIQKF